MTEKQDNNFELTIDPTVDPVKRLFAELVVELSNQPWMPFDYWQNRIVRYYASGVLGAIPELSKIASQKANNTRYLPLREFKDHAERVAKKLWENGDTRLHHEMAKYLGDDYSEGVNNYPFLHLPGDSNKSSHKVLLAATKKVAKDLGRPELISGKRKKL